MSCARVIHEQPLYEDSSLCESQQRANVVHLGSGLALRRNHILLTTHVKKKIVCDVMNRPQTLLQTECWQYEQLEKA